MRKVSPRDVLPHAVAIGIFLIVTIGLFSPAFFQNKALSQGDIRQHIGSSKDLTDYRAATGKEGLWAGSIFSGMPAYLVSVDWSDGVVVGMKKALSLFLPHPVCNIFLAFVSYYILLLVFKIRPWFAIAGALAFGLSSYMIIGLTAGHNARIGAIAFLPLVLAGVHLAFAGKRILGFGVTAAGMALHLRENHLQITYYMLMIVVLYGIVELISAIKSKTLPEFSKTIAVLVGAVALASATFFGQLWAISEFTKYSYRGASELVNPQTNKKDQGLPKTYAFAYSNGIMEPMTLFIPNYYGGSSSHYLVQDEGSKTYQALMQSGNQQAANQLAEATSAYWGPQQLAAPYYAGAIIVLLFVIGIIYAEKKTVVWLVTVSALSVMLSWGESFSTFNYFLFDYLPGYNKFRSVTFALVMILFAMPLLGLLGLEKLVSAGWNKNTLKQLWPALTLIGICALLALTGGFGDFQKISEVQLPAWFKSALRQDRMDLMKGDAWRTFLFMMLFFGALLMYQNKWIKEWMFAGAMWLLVIIDMTAIDKRFLKDENYQRKRDNYAFVMEESEKQVSKDKSWFRVYADYDGRPSYFFRSTGGYSGARLRRYQEVMDSTMAPKFQEMVNHYRSTGNLFKPEHNVFGMLNVKYYIAGQGANEYFTNDFTNGPAWFASKVEMVQSPNEELSRIAKVDTRETVVLDASRIKLSNPDIQPDSTASISLVKYELPYLRYESSSSSPGIAVFSEIYYPKGWTATIDGKEAPILQADYVLRALEVPAGKHVIEFYFQPAAYHIGDKVTMASSWILLLLVAGSLVLTWRDKQ